MSLRISLIVPAYNEERHLAACLDSLARQIRPLDEIIVVDNNSTDKTVEIASRYPSVKVVHEPRQGRVFAQIAGFMQAKGDILVRIDADARLPHEWNKHIAEYYDQPEHLAVAWTGGARFYNVRFPRIAAYLYNFIVFRLNKLLTGHPSLWGSNMALPAELWQQVITDICRRTDIHEDLDLAIHLHRKGYRIHHDRFNPAYAEMRRVHTWRKDLYAYLLMWPRTLKVHGIRSWPLCWLFGVALLYPFSPLLNFTERTARLFGKPPLSD